MSCKIPYNKTATIKDINTGVYALIVSLGIISSSNITDIAAIIEL